MEKALFDDLLQSLKEAMAISNGKTQASRRFEITPSDIKTVGNSEPVQLHGDIMRVLAAAYRVNEGDLERTVFWFINHPIAEFGHRTPTELLRDGKVEAVIKYLATLEGGATG